MVGYVDYLNWQIIGFNGIMNAQLIDIFGAVLCLNFLSRTLYLAKFRMSLSGSHVSIQFICLLSCDQHEKETLSQDHMHGHFISR